MRNLYRIFSAIVLLNLMFIVASAQKPAGEWKLVEAKQNGKRISLGREIRTSLTFGAENRMSGNAGCNRYSTVYALGKGNRIIFQPIISTKMACGDNNFMKQEGTFFDVMEKIRNYKIKGDYLMFSDANGRNTLRFVRVSKQNS